MKCKDCGSTEPDCYDSCECAKCVDPEGYEAWKYYNPEEYQEWLNRQKEEEDEEEEEDEY